MSSRRTLIVLSALALVSVVVVILDGGHAGQAVRDERRLVPAYARENVTGLRIERPGAADVVIRSSKGTLAMAAPVAAALDQAAITDLLGTVEVLTYRRSSRRRAEHGLDTPRVRLTVELGHASVVLALGARMDAIDRVWLGRSGDSKAYLIDGYAARALDRTAAELRSRRVFFAQPHEVTGIELHRGAASLVLSGAPLSVHRDGPGTVRMAAASSARLLALLDGLVLRFVASSAAVPDTALGDRLRIRVIGSHPARMLAELGPCPNTQGQRLVDTTAGRGCVSEADLVEISAYAGDPAATYDRTLVGAEPVETVTISAGTERVELAASGGGWRFVGGREASADSVRTMLRALDGPHGSPVEISASDMRTMVRRVVIGARGDTREVQIFETSRGVIARRAAEPVGFVVDPAIVAAVSPIALAYRSRELLSLEPSSLVEAIARTGTRVRQHVVRGALLEDWTARRPSGAKVALSAVRALGQRVARLRAVRFVAALSVPLHGLRPSGLVVELQFEPGLAGGPARIAHRIALGGRTKRGCYATLDSDRVVFELDRDTCAALTSSWLETRRR